RGGLDVLADALAHLELGESLALEAERERQALDDLDRLQQLDLLREAQVRGIAGGVGERAGLRDGPDELRYALVGPAQVENLAHDGPIFALELAGARRRRCSGRDVLDPDAQVPVRVRA